MHTFIANNRAELLARCKEKVARRPHRAATEAQLSNGIPLFLEQLQRTLEAEEGEAQVGRVAGAATRGYSPAAGTAASSANGPSRPCRRYW